MTPKKYWYECYKQECRDHTCPVGLLHGHRPLLPQTHQPADVLPYLLITWIRLVLEIRAWNHLIHISSRNDRKTSRKIWRSDGQPAGKALECLKICQTFSCVWLQNNGGKNVFVENSDACVRNSNSFNPVTPTTSKNWQKIIEMIKIDIYLMFISSFMIHWMIRWAFA